MGFKRGTMNGPLCEEEMAGVCILLQKIDLITDEETLAREDTFGAFSGQVISIVKDLTKRAMLNAQPRIIEGVYKCSFTASPENYGIAYGLINKCRGVVISEEI